MVFLYKVRQSRRTSSKKAFTMVKMSHTEARQVRGGLLPVLLGAFNAAIWAHNLYKMSRM